MDGIINGLDLTQLGIKWNKRVSNGSLTAGDRADINNDGVVNGLDLTKLDYGGTIAMEPLPLI